MYFANGDRRAFESLMRDKPGDHYDSGVGGSFPECLRFRCYRPYCKGLMVYPQSPSSLSDHGGSYHAGLC